MGLITFIPFYTISYMKGDPMTAGNLLFVFLLAGTVGTFLGGRLPIDLAIRKSSSSAWA